MLRSSHSVGFDKNEPSREWMASLRTKFRVEAEIDRVLSRKLERRADGPFRPVTLQALVDGVRSWLRDELTCEFELLRPRWLAGGASKLQMAFVLQWDRPGVGVEQTPLVLRMEPAESIVETSRLREFQLIKAYEGIVPVPSAFWVDSEGRHLPYPALICGFAEGVTKPTAESGRVSGIGSNFSPKLREILAPQVVEHLSLIHSFEFRKADLSGFEIPEIGIQAAEWQLNWWERVWEEDFEEDAPIVRLAMAWMRSNLPACDVISVVHGDYRSGNFLFTESDAQVSAWLDWELGHLGDRHEDLAWFIGRLFGNYAEDQTTFLASGLMPVPKFLELYEKHSGLTVDPVVLNFYRVLSIYKSTVHTLATCHRIAMNSKTHQDILIVWLSGIAYSLMDQLRILLEEVG